MRDLPSHRERIAEIEEKIDEMFLEHGFENLPENRISALEGLRDAWKEDPDDSFEKSMYQWSLTLLILHYQLKLISKK